MAQQTALPSLGFLVVEDEPLLRIMAVDLVQDAGFEAVEARSADEAVENLEARTDIRMVFTDVDMPGSMDGLKLAAAISDRWSLIAIIVTSGHKTVVEDVIPPRAKFFVNPYHTVKVKDMLHQMVMQ